MTYRLLIIIYRLYFTLNKGGKEERIESCTAEALTTNTRTTHLMLMKYGQFGEGGVGTAFTVASSAGHGLGVKPRTSLHSKAAQAYATS
jgi:hypothetical protein